MCISFPPCSPSCLLDSLLWVTRKKQGGGALKSYKRLIVKTFKSQVVWYLLNAATVTALCSSVGSQRKHVRSLLHVNLCVWIWHALNNMRNVPVGYPEEELRWYCRCSFWRIGGIDWWFLQGWWFEVNEPSIQHVLRPHPPCWRT